MANDTSDTSDPPRFTPKGERTRARIVEEAARLIHERSVAGTTLDDVRTAANVSGSQLSHYFPNKEELVQAVIDYQADTIVNNQQQANLGTVKGRRAWRTMVISTAKSTKAKGGCPLGSLGGQLAESDPEARALIAAGFERWSTAISDRLQVRHVNGRLPSDINADDLAVTLLAALQGGLLLAQVQQSTRPLETAVDTLLALAYPAPVPPHRNSGLTQAPSHGHDASDSRSRGRSPDPPRNVGHPADPV